MLEWGYMPPHAILLWRCVVLHRCGARGMLAYSTRATVIPGASRLSVSDLCAAAPPMSDVADLLRERVSRIILYNMYTLPVAGASTYLASIFYARPGSRSDIITSRMVERFRQN
jgi:hypothetical protein